MYEFKVETLTRIKCHFLAVEPEYRSVNSFTSKPGESVSNGIIQSVWEVTGNQDLQYSCSLLALYFNTGKRQDHMNLLVMSFLDLGTCTARS